MKNIVKESYAMNEGHEKRQIEGAKKTGMLAYKIGWNSVLLFTAVVFAWNSNSWSEEPVTPIGLLLTNPSAFHRRALRLEGITKDVANYSGYEVPIQRPLCGADFTLVDDTGAIDVLYHVRCSAGQEQASVVAEGAHVTVEGSMEAPSSVQRMPDGKQFEFKVYAHTV